MKSKGKGGREKRNKEGLIRLNGHSSQEKGRATRRGRRRRMDGQAEKRILEKGGKERERKGFPPP